MSDSPLKRWRTPILVLVGSVIVAALSVVVLRWVLFTYDSRLELATITFRERMIQVPVMTRTIGAGTVITAEDVQMMEIGAAYVAPDVLTRLDGIVGATAGERLLQGDMIRAERLSRPGSGEGLSAIIPTGMRALALNLRDGDQVSGFIDPGNAVDLIVTVPEDDDREAETVTLVQGVRVLAVDEKISETANGEEVRIPQVTLAVPPDLVEKLTHAVAIGQSKLTLRSEIDLHTEETNGARGRDLLLGRDQDRMSVVEYRAAFDDEAVARMLEIVHGRQKKVETSVDPNLLRGIE